MLWRICSKKAVNYYINLDIFLIAIRLAFFNLIFLMSTSEKNELNMVQYMWFKHSLMKQSVTKRSRREGGKETNNKLKDDWRVTKKYIHIYNHGKL